MTFGSSVEMPLPLVPRCKGLLYVYTHPRLAVRKQFQLGGHRKYTILFLYFMVILEKSTFSTQ